MDVESQLEVAFNEEIEVDISEDVIVDAEDEVDIDVRLMKLVEVEEVDVEVELDVSNSSMCRRSMRRKMWKSGAGGFDLRYVVEGFLT